MAKTRIGILVSGHGSNLQAIINAIEGGKLPGIEVAVVVSNRRQAYAITRAIRHGIPTVYFPLRPYTVAGRPRTAYDTDLVRIVMGFGVTWVVLAGWMHILSHAFIKHFPNRILNLHPALPGSFPGTHAIERAYQAYQEGRIQETGVMVHLVPDEAVDAGPVVAKATVPIYPQDTLETLEARIHETEHKVLIQALQSQLSSESQVP